MFSPRRKIASIFDVIPYTQPKLHTGKTWYVDFVSYDPLEQKMKRKKYMLDGIKKVSERKNVPTSLSPTLTSSSEPGGLPGQKSPVQDNTHQS